MEGKSTKPKQPKHYWMEDMAEKVGGSLNEAHYECAEEIENIMLKVKKIEQKLVMMQALMKIHHHTLDDKLDKVLLKMEQMEQKNDATNKSKKMEQKNDATNKSKKMEQKIDRTKMLQYILG